MVLTAWQTMAIILAIAMGAVLTRATPFLLFPEHKKPPDVISYLGRVLPVAMMGLLVIYCLKDVSLFMRPYGIPELLSIGEIVILHSWKRNVLLSIGGGTALYMFLVRVIFV